MYAPHAQALGVPSLQQGSLASFWSMWQEACRAEIEATRGKRFNHEKWKHYASRCLSLRKPPRPPRPPKPSRHPKCKRERKVSTKKVSTKVDRTVRLLNPCAHQEWGGVCIPLNQTACTHIDAADLPLLQGHRLKNRSNRGNRTHYAVIAQTVDGRTIQTGIHRVLLNTPRGMQVDHVDGNGLNNTRANLRLATPAQNQWNKHATHNRLGVKGVTYRAGRPRPYSAQIGMQGRRYYLGAFATLREATQAYNDAAARLFGEFAHPNDLSKIVDGGAS